MRDIVVIGTSAGGIDALKVLVSGLPPDLKASLFVVLHIAAEGLGILPEILQRSGPLSASNARNSESIQLRHIYVAPPDHHLLLEPSGIIRLSRGPKENRSRPAIDPLFRSAAHAFGSRVIGVVLTGRLDDGTAGMWAIKQRGGIAVVQQPQDALAPCMPRNALKHVPIDHCVPLREIPALLVELCHTPSDEKGGKAVSKGLETEVRIAKEENAIQSGIFDWAEPSLYACPECHGVLLQLKEGTLLRFRCHTGHAYSLQTLLDEFSERTEENLWSAIRSMEESALLLRRIATQVAKHRHDQTGEALEEGSGNSTSCRVNKTDGDASARAFD